MNDDTRSLIERGILVSIKDLKKEMLSRKEIKGLTIGETLEKLSSLTFENLKQYDGLKQCEDEISIEDAKKVINEKFKYTEFMIDDYEIQEKIRQNFNRAITEMEDNIDKYKKKLINSLTIIDNIYENIREFVLRELNEIMSKNKLFSEADFFQDTTIASFAYATKETIYILTEEEMQELNKKRLITRNGTTQYLVNKIYTTQAKEVYTSKLYPIGAVPEINKKRAYIVKYNEHIIEDYELNFIAEYNKMYVSLLCKGMVADYKDLHNYPLYQYYNIDNKTKETLLDIGCYTITLLAEHYNDIIERIMFKMYPKLEYVAARKLYYNQYETQVLTIEQIIDIVQFLVYTHKNRNCCLMIDITSDIDVRLTSMYQVLPKLESAITELTNRDTLNILDEPVYVIRLPKLVLNEKDDRYCNRMLEVADKCNIPAYIKLRGFDYYKHFYIRVNDRLREIVDKTLIEKDRTVAKMEIFNQNTGDIDNEYVAKLIERNVKQFLENRGVLKLKEQQD